MFNPYQTHKVKIKKIYKETYNIKRFLVEFVDKSLKKNFEFIPGQIMELSLPGYNEAPFAYCSSASIRENFEITVRRVGLITDALHNLKIGDVFGTRGPYGNGFPIDRVKNQNTLIIAGGIGLIPFRSLLQTICGEVADYQKDIQLFYGAKSEDELIFKSEYNKWCKRVDFHVTLDEGRKKKITAGLVCNIGLITKLFRRVKVLSDSIAIICGPPIMCKFVIDELKKLKFEDEDIYLSLERKMECGIGVCEHCAVGSKFVCKDGPIFSWAELKDVRGAV